MKKDSPKPSIQMITPEESLGISSEEWNELDESHLKLCIECVEECAFQDHEDFSKTISWLETLKGRMKGEAIKAVEIAIEKMCWWLKENKDHPFIGCEDPCLSGFLTDEFIECFKRFMKGE